MPPVHWQTLVDGMAAAFRGGDFEAGLTAAIGHADAALKAHFPLPDGGRNPNELPDAPVLVL